MSRSLNHTEYALGLALPMLIVLGFLLPDWIVTYLLVSLGTGLVALSVMILMRAGLVSFGQGLYFCIGGYSAGLVASNWDVTDLILLVAVGVIASFVVSFALGFLLRRYREIFFAMLSLALSMILFGLLSNMESLGSTDGFNLPAVSYLGWTPEGEAGKNVLYIASCVFTILCAFGLHRLLASPLGQVIDAIRENELRVEYLGASAHQVVHSLYVITAMVSGIGGVLWALALGHVDPEMTNWTTSGHFVFVSILSGTGSVFAPLIGTFLLEIIRVFAVDASPNTWQMIMGIVMLATILYVPKGLWSLLDRKAEPEKTADVDSRISSAATE